MLIMVGVQSMQPRVVLMLGIINRIRWCCLDTVGRFQGDVRWGTVVALVVVGAASQLK